jgi:hypothetical protein
MIKESESKENSGKSSQTESNQTLKELENLTKLPELETNLLLKLLNELTYSGSHALHTLHFKYDRYKSEFEELDFLGGGSFGKVYKVINCLDKQEYAVKIISFKGSLFYLFYSLRVSLFIK